MEIPQEIMDKDSGIKKIPLTKGLFALVDASDFEFLMQWKWCAKYYKTTKSYYAQRGRHSTRMHRVIMDVTDRYMFVDHRNHDTLDNRRSNLRIATCSQNRANSTGRGLSKYLGVSWHKKNKRWDAQIMQNKKALHLGGFKSEIEAAMAYDAKAVEVHGQFANLNFKSNTECQTNN